MDQYYILLLIFSIALLYASVGHGGASGYLALMAILGFAPVVMKPTALVLNILVSSIAAIQFYRSGHFKYQALLPFIILSIPMSFLGAKVPLTDQLYRILLGFVLLFAVARVFLHDGDEDKDKLYRIPMLAALLTGGIIGFLSGMLGIGGGVLLSPVLLFFNWATIKETAAISAPFIALNSIAGLLGLVGSEVHFTVDMYLWVLAALSGGFIGAYWGSVKLNSAGLRYLLSAVMVMAAIKLFIS